MGDLLETAGLRAYRAGIGMMVLTGLLTVWTTIVRDDSTGEGYFMVILAAGVGSFAARFQASGMARAMAGVAAMQALLGLLIATAPITASAPGGPFKVLLFNGVFVLLWLAAGVLFRSASRQSRAA
jgi:hypothetical protein